MHGTVARRHSVARYTVTGWDDVCGDGRGLTHATGYKYLFDLFVHRFSEIFIFAHTCRRSLPFPLFSCPLADPACIRYQHYRPINHMEASTVRVGRRRGAGGRRADAVGEYMYQSMGVGTGMGLGNRRQNGPHGFQPPSNPHGLAARRWPPVLTHGPADAHAALRTPRHLAPSLHPHVTASRGSSAGRAVRE